jgi:DNA-binding transcriptional ArsR family regulator
MQRLPFWRVCRVLANRPRLKIVGLLSRRPGLRVSAVAAAMKLSQPAASQYLRALESCGFVASRRVRRSVVYELGGRNADPTLQALIRALIIALSDKTSIEGVFKLATAFANPGRIDVFRNLSAGLKTQAQLRVSAGCSPRTLRRHLTKLESRGFVRRTTASHTYEAATHGSGFGRALAQAARS